LTYALTASSHYRHPFARVTRHMFNIRHETILGQ
jgi:hypothetical protein